MDKLPFILWILVLWHYITHFAKIIAIIVLVLESKLAPCTFRLFVLLMSAISDQCIKVTDKILISIAVG